MQITATIPLQQIVLEIGDAFIDGYVPINMPDATHAGLDVYELTRLQHHIAKLLAERKMNVSTT